MQVNPAPRKIDNFKTEKLEIVDFSLIKIICLNPAPIRRSGMNVKGGAG